jgi:hypothetical protein
MFSVMAFVFLAFFGIVLVLFYMMRISGQRYEILREELLKTQGMLRSLDAAHAPFPDKIDSNAAALVTPKQDDAPMPPGCVIESPLAMPEAGPARKTGVFDPALDLHFDSTADEH